MIGQGALFNLCEFSCIVNQYRLVQTILHRVIMVSVSLRNSDSSFKRSLYIFGIYRNKQQFEYLYLVLLLSPVQVFEESTLHYPLGAILLYVDFTFYMNQSSV